MSLPLDPKRLIKVNHHAFKIVLIVTLMTQRVGLRFAERQALQQKRAADAAAAVSAST